MQLSINVATFYQLNVGSTHAYNIMKLIFWWNIKKYYEKCITLGSYIILFKNKCF